MPPIDNLTTRRIIMSGYTVYWAKDYVKEVKKAGDQGPLKVVYGSPHTAMPCISSVKVGDIIYPVAIQNGTLAVMARLPVERLEPAFEYTIRELGRRHSALIPDDVAYYLQGPFGVFVCLSNGRSGYVRKTLTEAPQESGISEKPLPEGVKRIYKEWEMEEIPHQFTQIPKTCCAEQAASGEGSMIFPREIPFEAVKTMQFGKVKSKQKPLKLDKNGKLSSLSLSGFARKMSEETFAIFEGLF